MPRAVPLPFNVPLKGKIEPKGLAEAPPGERLAFYRRAGEVACRLLKAQLLAGVGADGERMAPRQQPRADGAAGPVLSPHRRDSRTIRLLDFRATADSVTLFWHGGVSRKQKMPWATVLRFHAEGAVVGAHLRDVRMAARTVAKVKDEMRAWWNARRRRPSAPSAPPPAPAAPKTPKAPRPSRTPAEPKPQRPPSPAPVPATAQTTPYTDTGLKARVEHAAYVRAEHDAAVPALAGAAGMTPEAYRSALQARFAAAVGHGELYVRVDSGVLPRVFDSGRFKNQFETGSSLGSLDPASRKRAEAELFGTPEATSPRRRPVYGYVGLPGFGGVGTAAERSLETYGDAVVRLKPGVRERATVTAGDSLSFHDMFQGSPASAPSAASLPLPGGRFRSISAAFVKERDPAANLRALGERLGYVEAQYHGGLDISDVAEVAFVGTPGPKTRAQLEAAGVPWRVIARGQDDG